MCLLTKQSYWRDESEKNNDNYVSVAGTFN